MKALRTMIGMAAVTMAVIACNVIEETTVLPQERLVEFTTTILPSAETRSTLIDNGNGTATASWDVGDKVYLEYSQVSSGGARTGKAQATVKTVNPSTGAATITATLVNPKHYGDEDVLIGYPYTPYNEGTADKIDVIQEGTLADIISNHVRMEATCALLDDGTALAVNPILENKVCIWKLVIKKSGGNNITSDIEKLNVIVNYGYNYYGGYNTVYSAKPVHQSAIYVALPGMSDVGITISADTNSTSYTMDKRTGITLANGSMYASTVTLNARNYPVNLADAVPADLGRPIGSDGKIYRSIQHAQLSLGKEPPAMVAFVKTDEGCDNCTKGLAIALRDCNQGAWSIITGSGGHLSQMNNNSGDQYYISGYTWRIPTLTDWQLMFKSFGGTDSYGTFALFNGGEPLDGGLFFSCGDLGTMIKAIRPAGCDFEKEAYWADVHGHAYYNFSDNKFYQEHSNVSHLFRPCFPF